jgi:hypothetical protein
MSRARDLGSSINSTAAGKNLVINGGMDIWQRGTTQSGGGSYFIADRWNHFRDAYASGITVSRQTASLASFQYCARIQRDSGNTSTNGLGFTQNIESINSIPFQGKSVTVSFWARAGENYSSSGSSLLCVIYSGTGTDEASRNGITGSSQIISFASTLTTSWQRFTATGIVPSNSNQILPTFYYSPTGTSGANDYYEITGIQLEQGSSATPFSRAGGDIQGELAKCQRYYWRTSTGGTYKGFGFGMGFSTTQARCMIQFPQTMRTTPAGVEGGGAIAVMDSVTGYLSTGISIDGNVMTPQSAYVNVSVASGLTQYRPYFLYSMADANAYIGFSAEL